MKRWRRPTGVSRSWSRPALPRGVRTSRQSCPPFIRLCPPFFFQEPGNNPDTAPSTNVPVSASLIYRRRKPIGSRPDADVIREVERAVDVDVDVVRLGILDKLSGSLNPVTSPVIEMFNTKVDATNAAEGGNRSLRVHSSGAQTLFWQTILGVQLDADYPWPSTTMPPNPGPRR